jgi:hypothetical protein
MRRQRCPILRAEVGHRLEVGDAAAVDPVKDLSTPIAGRAQVGQGLLELGAIEILRVDFHFSQDGSTDPAGRNL